MSLPPRRTIIPAPADPARWPKPHVNTESPELAAFTAVVHYDSRRRRSLTAVTGWRSAWASDGLETPGRQASRIDLYDENGDDELERRWIEALPGERLHRRFAYGLYGVSPTTGWWAVLYDRRQQVRALVAHGTDARAAEALDWPRVAIGLDRPGIERHWPALSQRSNRKPEAGRYFNHPPLFTPTALVHRMLAIGVAPITMMTSNLALIDRRTVTFDGIPWFGFHQDKASGQTIVIEVSASGYARRLGPLNQALDQIIERSWGATTSSATRLQAQGTLLPGAFDSLRAQAAVLASVLKTEDWRLDQQRLPALVVESCLCASLSDPLVVASQASVQEVFRGAGLVADGESLGQVAPGDRLLAKPVNVPHLTAVSPTERPPSITSYPPPGGNRAIGR